MRDRINASIAANVSSNDSGLQTQRYIRLSGEIMKEALRLQNDIALNCAIIEFKHNLPRMTARNWTNRWHYAQISTALIGMDRLQESYDFLKTCAKAITDGNGFRPEDMLIHQNMKEDIFVLYSQGFY
jgi:hypothetical protein